MTETHLFALIYVLTFLRLLTFFWPLALSSIANGLDRFFEGIGWPDLAPGLSGVHEFLDSIIYAGAAALFLIHFVVRSFYIPSESMIHTLEINDYILVNEMVYDFSQPMRGDIAVFHPPNPGPEDHTDLIKRVIGLAGDKIEVKDGAVYRNDERLVEPYLHEPIDGDWPEGGQGPHRVKPGCVFMMGDNRNNSQDSRFIGDIPLANFVGRAEVIFFPFRRLRVLH